jgi:hypothetical protein
MESATNTTTPNNKEGDRIEATKAALALLSEHIESLVSKDPVEEYFEKNKITRPRDIPIKNGGMVTDADLDRVDIIGESVSVLPQGEIRDQMLFLVLTINNLMFEKSAALQEAEQWKSRADFLLCELLKHTVILRQKW